MSSYIISCGGTGGHLAPGIALAERLRERGHSVYLLISRKDVDSLLVGSYPDLEFVRSPGAAFSWRPVAFLRFNWEQVAALSLAFRLLNRLKPDGVIGFGGFLSVGLVVAGFLRGNPIFLHEANRRPGRATRLLRGMAARVYLPDGITLPGLPPSSMRHYGYPVRREIKQMARDLARRRLGIEVSGKLVLVLGGSQGALALNRWAKEAFAELAEEGISLLCVTGLIRESRGQIEHLTKDGRIAKAIFMPFTNKMAEVLSCADLVVSRAGAGSLAEIIRCRLPPVLVPYPYATDDHQVANGRFLEQHGAAILVPQTQIKQLTREVMDLIYNDWMLDRLRSNLTRLDRRDGVDLMIDDMEKVLQSNRVKP